MQLNQFAKTLRINPRLIPTQQSRVLHYLPGPSRLRIGLKDPQVLDHFYQYRYTENMFPERFGECRYVPSEPYAQATFYSWENYLPSEYNEHWSYTSMWYYVVFGFGYLWFALLVLKAEIDSDFYKKPSALTRDFSRGLPFWGNEQREWA